MSWLNNSASWLTAICCLLFLSSVPAEAQVEISVGTGYLAGETQYQIGGTVHLADGSTEKTHFPLSELKFPIDAYMIRGQLDLGFFEKWGLMLRAETNLTEDTGKMEDSDWGVWEGSPTTQLDIFSESDTDMDAVLFEGKLTYEFARGYYGGVSLDENAVNLDILFSYTVGMGFKYQKFDFDISNLDQWYPSVPAADHVIVNGLVITYEAEYQIPYLELAMEMAIRESFEFGIGFAYAPYIHFQDEDHHLVRLRNKVNIADHGWDGKAQMIKFKGRYNFNENWSLQTNFEAMKMDSEGEAKSYLDGVWNHTVDHHISSHQYSGYLMVGYSF
jgi:outer membrane protease